MPTQQQFTKKAPIQPSRLSFLIHLVHHHYHQPTPSSQRSMPRRLSPHPSYLPLVLTLFHPPLNETTTDLQAPTLCHGPRILSSEVPEIFQSLIPRPLSPPLHMAQPLSLVLLRSECPTLHKCHRGVHYMHCFITIIKVLSSMEIHHKGDQAGMVCSVHLIPQNQNHLSFHPPHSRVVQNLNHIICRDQTSLPGRLIISHRGLVIQGFRALCNSLEMILGMGVLDFLIPIGISCKVPLFQTDLIQAEVLVCLHFQLVCHQIQSSILHHISRCIMSPMKHSILQISLIGPTVAHTHPFPQTKPTLRMCRPPFIAATPV